MRTKRLFLSFSIVFVAISTITFFSSMNYSTEFFMKSKTAIHLAMENLTGLNVIQDVPGNQNPENQKGSKSESGKALDLTWKEMGPDNIAGRTRAILVDKDSIGKLFAGSVGGGLWKSTTGGLSWKKIAGGDMFDNLVVSSICQASNGDIYFGTGEYFGSNTTTGFRGQGIFKSTDHGDTWTHLNSTWNDNDNSKQIFYYVSKLAIDPTNSNKIFAATAMGVRISTDGGSSWNNPVTDANADLICTDVQVSSDGQVVVVSLNKKAYLSVNGGTSFTMVSGVSANQIPFWGVGRMEFSIAPSDANYIYCLVADSTGGLKNVYQSTDKGSNWAPMIQVVNGQFLPFGLGKLGKYNNVIKVYPDNPQHLLLGGYDLFEWTPSKPWQQLTSGLFNFPGLQSYVQSGIHSIVFAPNFSSSNNVVYLATDGGVFKGIGDALYTGYFWSHLYKNYNATQFHSVSFSASGKIIGGTRNNGTIMIPLDLTNSQDAVTILSGDGGYCEFSNLNPNFIFATNPYGSFGRSYDEGRTITTDLDDIYPSNVTNGANIGSASGNHSFVTPIRLWESFYDTNSTQNILVEAPKKLVLGDTIEVLSPSQRLIKHVIDLTDLNGNDTIFKYDTIYVKDTYQSLMAVGLNGSVWLSREAHNMAKVPPTWYRFTNSSSIKQVQTMEFSADGDILYFADLNLTDGKSKIYRASNLTNGRDVATGDYTSAGNVIQFQELGTFNQKITSIAVDPSNSNNVIVTLGGYDNTDYVYYSLNAATTTSNVMADNFTSKQGDLPAMPVYSAVVLWNNSQKIVLGTEYGIYTTEDILAGTPNWTEQNANGMARVPVMQLRQQIHRNGWLPAPIVGNGINTDVTNHGYIYAATYGRGIFMCEDNKGPVSVPEITADKVKATDVKVYPNPVKDVANITFKMNKRSDVKISIYDINGALVKSIQQKNVNAGNQTIQFSTNGLAAGTYIAGLEMNGTRSTVKFVIN